MKTKHCIGKLVTTACIKGYCLVLLQNVIYIRFVNKNEKIIFFDSREKKSDLTTFKQDKKMAGGLGFEPRLIDPESTVLPLDDPPAFQDYVLYKFH